KARRKRQNEQRSCVWGVGSRRLPTVCKLGIIRRISAIMNFNQKIAVGVTDVAVLAELCISMFFANRDLENFSSVFFKYFFVMLLPTLVLARIFIKRLESAEIRPER
ncbi:MAG: hypothetical protein LLG06_15410, partial [Desulfobacteraceae bacterium]|nr:hypothetical protein [Desulfobacteraceae bacterium]